MSASTYMLVTIADLLRIPAERREACFLDLALALAAHELAFGDDALAAASALQEVIWTDDQEHHVTLQTGDEKWLELTVTKGQTL